MAKKPKKGIRKYFETFLSKESLFKDKFVLQSAYSPENIPHRHQFIEQIAQVLAPALRLDKPSNLFIYGKTGTGKTLSVTHTTNNIKQISIERDIPINILYINCKLKKIADTEYRLIAQLTREFGKEIPSTGLPTDEVYRIFFNTIDESKKVLIIVLDEIDQLIKRTGDEILYNLTRINADLKNAQMSIIGISNDLTFTDALDPRVKSSLSEEEIVFPPYNALQIQDILKNRSQEAFKPNVIEPGVVEKCAAYAAREHGDARRALDLLRVAGELAERKGLSSVKIAHIDEAEDKIERDRVVDIVKTQPKQFQVTLYSILQIIKQDHKNKKIFTGEVYALYKDFCNRIGLRPLTQRRISDIITELDMLGIINANVISKGKYGRTREITIAIPNSSTPNIFKILKNQLEL